MRVRTWSTSLAWVSAIASILVCLPACGSQPKPHEDASGTGAQAERAEPRRFDLRGKVVAVDQAGKRLTVDHEAIAGFMGAMMMAYPVKDGHLLDALSTGDHITAKVVSADGSYWLEEINVAERGARDK